MPLLDGVIGRECVLGDRDAKFASTLEDFDINPKGRTAGVGVGGVKVTGINASGSALCCVSIDKPGLNGAVTPDVTFFMDEFRFGLDIVKAGALKEEGIAGESLETSGDVELVVNKGERGAPAMACRPKARSTSVLGVRTDCASLKADVSPLILGLGDGNEDGTATDGASRREMSAAEVSSLDR